MADSIAKFRVVYVDGIDASKSAVKLWDGGAGAPTLDTTLRILGVTMTGSAYQEPVAVMKRGYIRSVTPGGTPVAGDLLWAQADGTVSKTKPTPPTPLVFVGTYLGGSVVHVDVKVFPSMSELSHVKIETPVEFDVFIWDPAQSAFVPRKMDHGGDLAGLADDDHTQYALADKSRPAPWVAAADLAARSLADLGTKDHGALTGLLDDDHTQYLKEAVLTVKGDVFVATGASTPVRLPVGALGEYLTPNTAAATGLQWRTIPSCCVYHNAAQSIPYNAWTTLNFNLEIWDSESMHDNSINNSRITLTTPGKYLIYANVRWATDATGRRLIKLLRNGALIGQHELPPLTSVGTFMHFAVTDVFTANQYVQVQVYQSRTPGTPLNIEASGNVWPRFGAFLFAP